MADEVRGLVDGVHDLRAALQLAALVRMPDPDAAAETVARLERMGALAGAAELSPDPPMSRG